MQVVTGLKDLKTKTIEQELFFVREYDQLNGYTDSEIFKNTLFHQQAHRNMKLEINMDFTGLTLIFSSQQAYQFKKITPHSRFSKLSPNISQRFSINFSKNNFADSFFGILGHLDPF